VTFAVSAFLVAGPLLAVYTALPGHSVFAIAAAIALLTCFVEAISSRGLDNLVVPAVAWLVLYWIIGGA
jgi:dolichol kinase